ncbi:TonB C-terminal domain-containing protein [Rhodoplanes sp. TEM]|uniref:TonB C-terminal domain-containing protein n=1 Tax=Rhodoplanes tepidamans TaxID=200616 RepID=A0ABT5JBP6_RHOTP|nr:MULTISPECIES: TonB C-terminal domain-containing protein [Rhodoplanes]MDC7787022.1 TonB C-terminal domain-containing protein [Rhodoplanes tepidamans]MDC7986968.1 TonB C-terminal domain-containing protein [Rhodoplanes sp. TEM]MDQ0354253.1 outer membrane biosynthesis protein TonB [Rhodoplanes tepidamans]
MTANRDSRDGRRRFGIAAGGAAIVLALAAAGIVLVQGSESDPPRRVQEFVVVVLPPPPPPPQVQPPPEEKMIEAPKMAEPEFKPEKPAEKPIDEKPAESASDEPPGPPALDVDASGPGDMAAKKGGRSLTAGGGGSLFAWYNGVVTSQIQRALMANPKTRSSVAQMQVRVWVDGTGRIVRIVLGSSSGNAEIDSAVRDEILSGLVLREPPPPNMPMPMVARIVMRRPT